MGDRFVRLIHSVRKMNYHVLPLGEILPLMDREAASRPGDSTCGSSPDDPLPAQSDLAMEIAVDRGRKSDTDSSRIESARANPAAAVGKAAENGGLFLVRIEDSPQLAAESFK